MEEMRPQLKYDNNKTDLKNTPFVVKKYY